MSITAAADILAAALAADPSLPTDASESRCLRRAVIDAWNEGTPTHRGMRIAAVACAARGIPLRHLGDSFGVQS